MAARSGQLEVEGRRLDVSNLDKVLYPGGRKFRKGDVLDFYARVAEVMLPHLEDRPVTRKRFPDGVTGEFFYEKDAPSFTPEWVRTAAVARRRGGPPIRYIVIDDLATLVWLANLGNLEIHPFLHRSSSPRHPTWTVFDLDPGEGADVLSCAQVAALLRELLDGLGLESFAKVSGSKGIQVYVPLGGSAPYTVTSAFARGIARLLEERHPKLVVSEMSKALRTGKVFIDWSQNTDFKTTVAVYSLRAKSAVPYVSMPVEWDELAAALKAADPARLYFTPGAALRRLAKMGDLFAPVLAMRQELPDEVLRAFRKRGAAPAALDDYRAKRNFSKTPEPAPGAPRASRQGGRRRFVVQKHAASHLHYDFRLEMHGALKSWAVPKGPSTKKDEARLARATEDHPLAYLDFEGIIPKGQYGGGTVMVWDIGTWELLEGNYYKGFLHIHLDGSKLRGEWTLRAEDAERKNWKLVRAGRSAPAVSASDDDRSALSGRSMREIADAADSVWQSDRAAAPSGREPRKSERTAREPRAAAADISVLKSLPDAPADPEPMLAKPAARLPEGDEWSYEIKLDGYRAIGSRIRGKARLRSRRAQSLDLRYPAVRDALDDLPEGTIVDGEVVALDENGKPSFAALQNAGNSAADVVYFLFDAIAWRGRDLRSLPYSQRRAILQTKIAPALGEPVRLSETFDSSAHSIVEVVREQGLEGVVAKRRDSTYESGKRSGAWQKFKTSRSQELVIGGYLPGPDGFESLLVGHYAGRRLLFDGKIRNGFVPTLKRKVARRMTPFETKACPFANLPEKPSARRGEALTKEVMDRCRWLRPELVAEIHMTEWTRGEQLRHPRFAGLRDDKDARDVVRE